MVHERLNAFVLGGGDGCGEGVVVVEVVVVAVVKMVVAMVVMVLVVVALEWLKVLLTPRITSYKHMHCNIVFFILIVFERLIIIIDFTVSVLVVVIFIFALS